MRILGIDYGEKRIGLAISDESELIASPMTSLKVKSFADAVAKVQRIAKTQNVAAILIGLPLGSKGEETKQSIQVRYFADALKMTNGNKIEFWNESFSTKEASNSTQWGTSRKKKNLDSEVARIILQEYMDYRRELEKGGALLPIYEAAVVKEY